MRDTSGRGNDAVFRGSSSYDVTEKAFNLTSHDKDLVVVRDNISGVSGDILATISLWFKTDDTTQTAGMSMFQIGHANITGHKLNIFLYEDDVYMGWGGQNYVYAPSGDVKGGKWTHVVGIKKGTGAVGNGTVQSGHTAVLELYIDGLKKTVTNWTGTDTVNITKDNQIITVGAGSLDSTTRSNGFDGFISTVKFWGGVVLTAEEVKTLYDMGRCDEGHHTTIVSRSQLRMGGENLVIEPHRGIGGFYEEGTWYPIVFGHTSGKKTPASANMGWWIRVGNLVSIGGTIHWIGGDTLVGQVRVGYLPYKSNSTTDHRTALNFGVANGGITTTSGQNTVRLLIDPGFDWFYITLSNEYRSTTLNYTHSPTIESSGIIYGIGGTYKI